MVLKLSLKLEKKKVKLGNKIPVKVTLRNTSEKKIRVCTIWQPDVNIKFEIISSEREIESLEAQRDFISPRSKDFKKMKKNEKITKSYNLFNIMNIDEPGEYTVRAFYKNMYDYYYKKPETLREILEKVKLEDVSGEIISSNAVKIKIE